MGEFAHDRGFRDKMYFFEIAAALELTGSEPTNAMENHRHAPAAHVVKYRRHKGGPAKSQERI